MALHERVLLMVRVEGVRLAEAVTFAAVRFVFNDPELTTVRAAGKDRKRQSKGGGGAAWGRVRLSLSDARETIAPRGELSESHMCAKLCPV